MVYGLLLDCIQKLLREKYGERYWANIRRRAKLKNHWFVTHDVYSDSVMMDLVDAAVAELGMEQGAVMRMFGEYFAQNIGRYGYARLLRVLGRDLRDFLNGLDDLHEYLRFSYPKMRPPSFYCENETPHGMILHYNTQRRGYLEYVIGQLKTVGKIYGKDIDVEMESEEQNGNETHVILQLNFDNREMLRSRRPSLVNTEFKIDSDTFLTIFPFVIMFGEDMTIKRVGLKLEEVLPNLIGENLDTMFSLRRPQFGSLTWKLIRIHPNCVFELVSSQQITRSLQPSHDRSSPGMEFQSPPPFLKLKGQMLYLVQLDTVAFLSSPTMDSPEDLYESGIFINDLSMHDSSRDFILAGTQQNPELNLALDQEKIRSAQLEDSIERTDKLLYQMLPKPIADKLRKGETPLNTCREFPAVSILFSDIVSFTPMCSRLRPMEVVCVLNAMYVAFDKLCEDHHVYAVETIGDAYMVICGAPVCTPHHAEYLTDFAFSIIKATSKIEDPSTGKNLKIRVGIHSGTVVAGVVGTSIMRYDVFGDTVNVAARMEATGEPMRVHVSEHTAELLQGTNFITETRGHVEVKGKGMMTTFWVTGKKNIGSSAELNPFQRQSRDVINGSSRLSPSRSTTPPEGVQQTPPLHSLLTQQPPTSTPSTTPSYSVTKTFRRLSPKPDEWPQADRRLSHMDSEKLFQLERERRHTIPMLDVTSPSPDNPRIRMGSIPYMWPTQSQRRMARQSTSGSDSSTFALTGPLSPRVSTTSTSGGGIMIHPDLSELNLLHIRDSISLPLSTIAEGGLNLAQLSQFAQMAEENAQHARRMADLAVDMLKVAVDRSTRHNSKDYGGGVTGTPVDAPQTIGHSSSGLNQFCPVLEHRESLPTSQLSSALPPPPPPPQGCPVGHERTSSSDLVGQANAVHSNHIGNHHSQLQRMESLKQVCPVSQDEHGQPADGPRCSIM